MNEDKDRKATAQEIEKISGGDGACGGFVGTNDNSDITISPCNNITNNTGGGAAGGFIGGVDGDSTLEIKTVSITAPREEPYKS